MVDVAGYSDEDVWAAIRDIHLLLAWTQDTVLEDGRVLPRYTLTVARTMTRRRGVPAVPGAGGGAVGSDCLLRAAASTHLAGLAAGQAADVPSVGTDGLGWVYASTYEGPPGGMTKQKIKGDTSGKRRQGEPMLALAGCSDTALDRFIANLSADIARTAAAARDAIRAQAQAAAAAAAAEARGAAAEVKQRMLAMRAEVYADLAQVFTEHANVWQGQGKLYLPCDAPPLSTWWAAKWQPSHW